MRISVFLTFLVLYLALCLCSFSNFLGLTSLVVLFFLKLFDFKKILEIEKKLEPKFIDENTENFKKVFDQVKDNKIKENYDAITGNFIKINSVFNSEISEILKILNDFSLYNLIDGNISIAEKDNSFGQNLNFNENISTLFYSLSFKNKKPNIWGMKPGKNKNNKKF